jgi:hypothetical protein
MTRPVTSPPPVEESRPQSGAELLDLASADQLGRFVGIERFGPAPRTRPEVRKEGRRLLPDLAEYPEDLGPSRAVLDLQPLTDLLRERGRRATGADRDEELASADHRGRRPVAPWDIVNHIDQRSGSAGRFRDARPDGRIGVVCDHEERSGQVGRVPGPAVHDDAVQPLEVVEPIRGLGRDDHHIRGAAGQEPFDLALAHRERADHDASPVRQLQEDRIGERHQQATV